MTATLFMRMQVENFDTWLNPAKHEIVEAWVGADVMMSSPS